MDTHFYTTSNTEALAAIANMSAVAEGTPFSVLSQSGSDFVPMFRMRSTRGTHLYTTFIDERDVAINEDGYAGEGIAFWCLPIGRANGADFVNLYRGYDPATDDHLYTLDLLEAQTIGYQIEGVAGVVSASALQGVVPLFRLRSPGSTHFYTIDANQKQSLLFLGFIDEGTCGFVSPNDQGTGQSRFYRSYNPATGGHFYTLDISEHDTASRDGGYRGDGISCFIYPDGAQPEIAIPLYRCFNASLNDHLYTTDPKECDKVICQGGYISGGKAGWVLDPSNSSLVEFATPCLRLYGDFQPNFFLLAPDPPKRLTSNSNFYLGSFVGATQNLILGLSVSISIQADIVIKGVNKGVFGFTFQLNAYSPVGYTSAWQQYVMNVIPGQASWNINNYTNDPAQPKLIPDILGGGNICNVKTGKDSSIRAGTTYNIALLYDVEQRVIGANFSVFEGDKEIGNKVALIKDIHNGKKIGPAPILAIQMFLVGFADGDQTTLKPGGAGAFAYRATSPLNAQVLLPDGVGAPGDFTVETANSVYGQISATKSKSLVQGFRTDGTTY